MINFSARFLKAHKIGIFKRFTLSCNAKIQLQEKSLELLNSQEKYMLLQNSAIIK